MRAGRVLGALEPVLDDGDELIEVGGGEVAKAVFHVRPGALIRPGPSPGHLDVAPKAGLETFRVPLPVDWNFARAELTGQFKPAYTNSDIAFGVNNGGKHSIDVT